MRRVLVGGGGLAGLAAAKQLVDAGYQVELIEKRPILGGKWSSWKDADGEWLETGLHVFFGAYDEIFTLMKDLNIYDRILWKDHILTYTLDEGERFSFKTEKLPPPFHLVPSLLTNKYFTMMQKLSLAKNLVPMLYGGDDYYQRMDAKSYEEWHTEHGISPRMLKKFFLPLALALKFVDPPNISAKIVLDVSGIFLRVNEASKMGFLKGSPETHLMAPIADYITQKGGKVRTGVKITEIQTGADGKISGLAVQHDDGSSEVLTADDYVLAMPIHNLKKVMPQSWVQQYPYFGGLNKIIGVPVVTAHVWMDRQVSYTDNILFSPDGVIPVYADMANTTPEYRTNGNGTMASRKSRFQFVVAPAYDLINMSDEEIMEQVKDSILRNFPETGKDAKVEKYNIVRVPQSVYWPKPGIDQYRVPQKSPIDNLFLAGGYTQQRFYDSMEGAVRSGNRAAQALIARDRQQAWMPTP